MAEMASDADRSLPVVRVIPQDDRTFADHVRGTLATAGSWTVETFQDRLRQLHPLVTVRERGLDGEQPTWYVYKHGRWMPPSTAFWWQTVRGTALRVDLDGWLLAADPQVRDLLAIPRDWPRRFHVTEFAAPGTAVQLIVRDKPLPAQIVALPFVPHRYIR